MATRKHILNNSKLVEITIEESVPRNWIIAVQSYEYHYLDRQVAIVSFSGSTCEVDVHKVLSPWAYVFNDKGEFFCRISQVEDQIHGVNIIDMDNLQALFIERETNLNLQAEVGNKVINTLANQSSLTAQMYANMFNQNVQQAKQSAIASISKSTFPMWGKVKNKLTGIK